jgi:hypothetical protein
MNAVSIRTASHTDSRRLLLIAFAQALSRKRHDGNSARASSATTKCHRRMWESQTEVMASGDIDNRICKEEEMGSEEAVLIRQVSALFNMFSFPHTHNSITSTP